MPLLNFTEKSLKNSGSFYFFVCFLCSLICVSSRGADPDFFAGMLQKTKFSIDRSTNEKLYTISGAKIVGVFKIISKESHVIIRVEDEELSNLKVVIGCENAKGSDILDAISAYSASRWKKMITNFYW